MLDPASGTDISRRNSTCFSPIQDSSTTTGGGLLSIQAGGGSSCVRRRSTTCVNASDQGSSTLLPSSGGGGSAFSRRGSSFVGENKFTNDRHQLCSEVGTNRPLAEQMDINNTGNMHFDNPVYGSRGQVNDFTASSGGVGVDREENRNMVDGREVMGEEELLEMEGAAEEEDHVVCKVLVLGSHGVGKTTLTQQLLTSEYLANKRPVFAE